MRGARLLHLLMLLQNRGQMTSAELATELEVSRRTVLRDLDAMTEAGLPVIATQGTGGGISLGFDYRARFIAMTGDEAEALALMLSGPHPALGPLGLEQAARRAAGKVLEAQSEAIRARMARAQRQFHLASPAPVDGDPRPEALALAVRERRCAVLRWRGPEPVSVHPVALRFDGRMWVLDCAVHGAIAQRDWGDVQISARTFG